MARMYRSYKIGVVIPAFRVSEKILAVVRSVPEFVDRIYVVDDFCPEGSGRAVARAGFRNAEVLHNPRNLGVGGAVQRGYRAGLRDACDLLVKIDGDGQMDPAFLEALIEPIVTGRADYAKGNRFRDLDALASMPLVRLLGNSSLCLLVKFASGYWGVNDPTNGYTAIRATTMAKLLDRGVARSYFFECDMLIHLSIIRARVADVRIPARYGDERSSLSISRVLLEFPVRLTLGVLKRWYALIRSRPRGRSEYMAVEERPMV